MVSRSYLPSASSLLFLSSIIVLCVFSTSLAQADQPTLSLLADQLDHTDSSNRFCFVSYGCWGGHDKSAQRRVAEGMGRFVGLHNHSSKGAVKFVIAAGDNFYKKGVTGVTDPRFFTGFEHVYRDPSLLSLPFFVALGNHDYRGDFQAQVTFTKYQLEHYAGPSAAGKFISTGRWYLPHAYYSKQVHRDMVLIVLDTPLLERCFNNGDPSPRCWDHGAQRQFVKDELERYSHVLFKVVVGHYPMFANGPHVNFPWLIEWLQPLLEQHDAALYINADNHYLQVSVVNGVVYANSGGGAGMGMRHTPANSKNYNRNPFSEFIAFEDGIMMHCVDVEQGTMRTEAVDPQGRVLHTTSWTTSRRGRTTRQSNTANLADAAASQRPPMDADPQRSSRASSSSSRTTKKEIVVIEALPPGPPVHWLLLGLCLIVLVFSWKSGGPLRWCRSLIGGGGAASRLRQPR